MTRVLYDPRVTAKERELSGLAALIYRINSCQFHPWPQDDVVLALSTIFRRTSREIERLRNEEESYFVDLV